jgi:hypothetical protein
MAITAKIASFFLAVAGLYLAAALPIGPDDTNKHLCETVAEFWKSAGDRCSSSLGPYVLYAAIILAILCLGALLFDLILWVRRRRSATKGRTEELSYLRHKDTELGEAIRQMAWFFAWAKWYASQVLATNEHRAASAKEIIDTARFQVQEAILNGQLQVRGRKAGSLNYEEIPRTHWRSTGLMMVKDDLALWKLVLLPAGGAQIDPDGTVVGQHQPSVDRTSQLSEFDSFIVCPGATVRCRSGDGPTLASLGPTDRYLRQGRRLPAPICRAWRRV